MASQFQNYFDHNLVPLDYDLDNPITRQFFFQEGGFSRFHPVVPGQPSVPNIAIPTTRPEGDKSLEIWNSYGQAAVNLGRTQLAERQFRAQERSNEEVLNLQKEKFEWDKAYQQASLNLQQEQFEQQKSVQEFNKTVAQFNLINTMVDKISNLEIPSYHVDTFKDAANVAGIYTAIAGIDSGRPESINDAGRAYAKLVTSDAYRTIEADKASDKAVIERLNKLTPDEHRFITNRAEILQSATSGQKLPEIKIDQEGLDAYRERKANVDLLHDEAKIQKLQNDAEKQAIENEFTSIMIDQILTAYENAPEEDKMEVLGRGMAALEGKYKEQQQKVPTTLVEAIMANIDLSHMSQEERMNFLERVGAIHHGKNLSTSGGVETVDSAMGKAMHSVLGDNFQYGKDYPLNSNAKGILAGHARSVPPSGGFIAVKPAKHGRWRTTEAKNIIIDGNTAPGYEFIPTSITVEAFSDEPNTPSGRVKVTGHVKTTNKDIAEKINPNAEKDPQGKYTISGVTGYYDADQLHIPTKTPAPASGSSQNTSRGYSLNPPGTSSSSNINDTDNPTSPYFRGTSYVPDNVRFKSGVTADKFSNFAKQTWTEIPVPFVVTDHHVGNRSGYSNADYFDIGLGASMDSNYEVVDWLKSEEGLWWAIKNGYEIHDEAPDNSPGFNYNAAMFTTKGGNARHLHVQKYAAKKPKPFVYKGQDAEITYLKDHVHQDGQKGAYQLTIVKTGHSAMLSPYAYFNLVNCQPDDDCIAYPK